MDRVLLRNSERSAFKTCRFRWGMTYGGVFEVGPVRSQTPAKALWFGDLVHRALEPYYRPGTKRGPAPAKTFLKLYDADDRLAAVLRDDEGEWTSMRDLGAGMLEGYVEKYREKDEEWEVISSERTFRLPMIVPAMTLDLVGPALDAPRVVIVPAFRLIVVGTLDGVWRHRVERERYVFKEFKTAAQIQLDGLNMDDQASLYFTYGPKALWRARAIPEGLKPSEILYTFLRKAAPNPDKTYDELGRVLNKPTKERLQEEFRAQKLGDPGKLTVAALTEVLEEKDVNVAALGEPSASQPSPYFERQPIYRDDNDRRELHERVLSEARDMWMVRHGISAPYKNPGPLHSPNCRGCPVRDACELHETGNDWMSMLNASTEPWDPYAAHELAERR